MSSPHDDEELCPTRCRGRCEDCSELATLRDGSEQTDDDEESEDRLPKELDFDVGGEG